MVEVYPDGSLQISLPLQLWQEEDARVEGSTLGNTCLPSKHVSFILRLSSNGKRRLSLGSFSEPSLRI